MRRDAISKLEKLALDKLAAEIDRLPPGEWSEAMAVLLDVVGPEPLNALDFGKMAAVVSTDLARIGSDRARLALHELEALLEVCPCAP